MRRVLLFLSVTGCLGPKAGIEHWPTPQIRSSDSVHLGVLGAAGTAGPDLDLQADIAARRPDALLLTGDLSGSRRRDLTARRAWLERLGIPALGGLGPREQDARAELIAMHGVGHASWGSVDIATRGAVWRVLVLDPTASGNDRQDQMFWVPKVASQVGYEHLIVLCSTPVYTLAEGFEREDQARARELLAAVEAHAGLDRIRLVVAGTTETHEAILPAGPWGELWLIAGTSGAPGQLTAESMAGPRGTILSMAPGLRDEIGTGASPASWWELHLDGGAASLRMRTHDPAGRVEEVWRIHYDREDGWSRAVE